MIAVSTERQMLGTLAQRFPDGDPIISDLQRNIDARLQLITGPASV